MPSKKSLRRMPQRLLRSLHLVGLGFLDPVVLAALADERPLLLIGRTDPDTVLDAAAVVYLAASAGLGAKAQGVSIARPGRAGRTSSRVPGSPGDSPHCSQCCQRIRCRLGFQERQWPLSPSAISMNG